MFCINSIGSGNKHLINLQENICTKHCKNLARVFSDYDWDSDLLDIICIKE